MYFIHRLKRSSNEVKSTKRKKGRRALLLALLAAATVFMLSFYLKELATTIAVSDASDHVTKTVNKAISDVVGGGEYSYDYFVNLQKDEKGRVSAVTSDMAHINTLSAEILNAIISSTDNGTLSISIPVGNLSGLNILMNRGPEIVVDIMMLTSSRVDFRNEVIPCGINQAKYQLILEIVIDIDVLVPWGRETAETVTELIVADTIIIGEVPNTYLNTEN